MELDAGSRGSDGRILIDWYAQIAAEHPLATSAIDLIRYVLEYGITAGLTGSAYTQLNTSK